MLAPGQRLRLTGHVYDIVPSVETARNSQTESSDGDEHFDGAGIVASNNPVSVPEVDILDDKGHSQVDIHGEASTNCRFLSTPVSKALTLHPRELLLGLKASGSEADNHPKDQDDCDLNDCDQSPVHEENLPVDDSFEYESDAEFVTQADGQTYIIVSATSEGNSTPAQALEVLPLQEPRQHLHFADPPQCLSDQSTETACCSTSCTRQGGQQYAGKSNDQSLSGADDTSLASVAARSPGTVFTPKILLQLLQTTEEGKDIIKYADIAELSEAKQLELAGIIAKYHLNTKCKLRTEDLETYALAVTSLFKFERKVK